MTHTHTQICENLKDNINISLLIVLSKILPFVTL